MGCLLDKKKKAVNVRHRTNGREFYAENKSRTQRQCDTWIPSWSQIISKHERQMNVLSSAHDSKTMFQGISGVHASIPRV